MRPHVSALHRCAPSSPYNRVKMPQEPVVRLLRCPEGGHIILADFAAEGSGSCELCKNRKNYKRKSMRLAIPACAHNVGNQAKLEELLVLCGDEEVRGNTGGSVLGSWVVNWEVPTHEPTHITQHREQCDW